MLHAPCSSDYPYRPYPYRPYPALDRSLARLPSLASLQPAPAALAAPAAPDPRVPCCSLPRLRLERCYADTDDRGLNGVASVRSGQRPADGPATLDLASRMCRCVVVCAHCQPASGCNLAECRVQGEQWGKVAQVCGAARIEHPGVEGQARSGEVRPGSAADLSSGSTGSAPLLLLAAVRSELAQDSSLMMTLIAYRILRARSHRDSAASASAGGHIAIAIAAPIRKLR